MQGTLKVIAALIVFLAGVQWIWGQDQLDRMGVVLTPAALLLPSRLILLCAVAWLIRATRRRVLGLPSAPDPFLRRDRAIVLLGLSAVAFIFAFVLNRLGHTPHRTLVSAAAASAWDAGGLVGIVFCGACWYGGGRT